MEDGKPKAKSNPMASIQGKGLPTPVGTKKAAKKSKLDSRLEMESLATAAHTEAVMSVAKAASDLNKSFDKKRKMDSMHKTVDAYIKMGQRPCPS